MRYVWGMARREPPRCHVRSNRITCTSMTLVWVGPVLRSPPVCSKKAYELLIAKIRLGRESLPFCLANDIGVSHGSRRIGRAILAIRSARQESPSRAFRRPKAWRPPPGPALDFDPPFAACRSADKRDNRLPAAQNAGLLARRGELASRLCRASSANSSADVPGNSMLVAAE